MIIINVTDVINVIFRRKKCNIGIGYILGSLPKRYGKLRNMYVRCPNESLGIARKYSGGEYFTGGFYVRLYL